MRPRSGLTIPHNPRISRKRSLMKGQKRCEVFWVVCGRRVLLRTRDIGSARAFQNGLGLREAQVVAIRVVWDAPRTPDTRLRPCVRRRELAGVLACESELPELIE